MLNMMVYYPEWHFSGTELHFRGISLPRKNAYISLNANLVALWRISPAYTLYINDQYNIMYKFLTYETMCELVPQCHNYDLIAILRCIFSGTPFATLCRSATQRR